MLYLALVRALPRLQACSGFQTRICAAMLLLGNLVQPDSSCALQALEVVCALLDPLPVPAESANAPDSPAAVTELHAAVRSATVQARTHTWASHRCLQQLLLLWRLRGCPHQKLQSH